MYIYSFLEDIFIAQISSMVILAGGLIITAEMGEPEQISGKQELYESIINQHI